MAFQFRLLGLALGIGLIFSVPAQAGFLSDLKKKVDSVVPSANGNTTGSTASSNLSLADITAGLREALKIGTERVVSQLGAENGYFSDADIHIPLPPELQQAQSYLKKFGLSALADDLELRLNRAAEDAAPATKQLFWNTITSMSFSDASQVLNGPDNAATEYFKRVASSDLAGIIRPVVDDSLKEVGALTTYDQLVGEYQKIPFVPDIKADLSEHAVNFALKGLFHYLAQEEAAIRKDPTKRSSELLMKVFGG